MKWKKFIAVFLTAGVIFTAPAAVSAYATQTSISAEETAENITSDQAKAGAGEETGSGSAEQGEDTGSGNENAGTESGSKDGGFAADNGETDSESGESGHPAGSDETGGNTGSDSEAAGTDGENGGAGQEGTGSGSDSGSAGTDGATPQTEGGEDETDDKTPEEAPTEEAAEPSDGSGEETGGNAAGGTGKAGSKPANNTTTSGTKDLPASVLPGSQTIGAMKDAVAPNAGLMEQIEAAQQIITGNQESGYATRARSEKEHAGTAGSTHYVRPGSVIPDPYAPQVGSIVASPVLKKEFRFWTVAKESAIAKKKLPIREEMKSNSRTIGVLPENGVCYILKEEDGGWIYVESGTVRGFVRKELLISGLKATTILETRQFMADFFGNLSGQTVSEEEILKPAEEKVPAAENAALTYRRATVYQTVVDKDPALAAWDVSIREEKAEDAREIGILKKGGICYVITDRDQDWVYVESGDVRGFVQKEDLIFSDTKLNEEGKTLKEQIEERGESAYSLASELVPAEENEALYYSLMSIRSGIPGSSRREAVLSYAAQFIGNPYVWGGTDPVHGADCSGFVQTIYKQFGYTLPRIAAQQALSGEKIPVSEALPGDLIFYGNASGIYHVVICAGGNQTIEAKGRQYGIVSSTLNQKAAVWAIRVIDDADAIEYDIPEGLGKIHSYMGWQKVTNVHSQQYAFRKAAGMTFDKEGFAVVDNRYVIACTDTYGAIGDYIDFYQEDGTKIPCIIGDFKNEGDAGCNKWGHMNGQCIVEFVVDQYSWYPSRHANPGTSGCHPEWHQNIVKAEKVGSFYE